MLIQPGAGGGGAVGVAGGGGSSGTTAINMTGASIASGLGVGIVDKAMDNADDNICEPDEENKECQKAILNAKSAAQRLAKKRIPQYVYAYRNGYADAGHYKAIIEAQGALRDALRRIDLHCKVKPPEYNRWQQQVNNVFPKKH